jgi:prefoldin subunit 5
MSETLTRRDIDEVIEILKDFMGQVSNQSSEVTRRLDSLDEKYDHLLNT